MGFFRPEAFVSGALGAVAVLGLAALPGVRGSLPAPVQAQESQAPDFDIRDYISDMNPEIRVDKVDAERITTRRIDLVDDDGTIRVIVASPLPDPVIDGIAYQRSVDVHGMLFNDTDGSERGGVGFADGVGAQIIFDHRFAEGVGMFLRDSGETGLQFVPVPEPEFDPALGGRQTPSVLNAPPTRMTLQTAADGTPSIELNDAQGRPRLRLTVDEGGAGSIQFLDETGEVIDRVRQPLPE